MSRAKAKPPEHNGIATGGLISEGFRRVATAASARLGSHWAFLTAVAVVVGWAVSGPIFGFSERWQLIINTVTTIVTFLMVFLVQATQNRDARAIHLKLDELIRASGARNLFADIEDASEAELDELQREFEELRRRGHRPAEAVVKAHQIVHHRRPRRHRRSPTT